VRASRSEVSIKPSSPAAKTEMIRGEELVARRGSRLVVRQMRL
jgi:hypothetical protein